MSDSPAARGCQIIYGVIHMNPGGQHLARYQDRDEAERSLRDCWEDDADCYLVRARVAWERVPDDEDEPAAVPETQANGEQGDGQ